MNKMKLKLTALALTGTMIAFAGCESEKTPSNKLYSDDAIILDTNENNQKLCVIIEVDKATNYPLSMERYGYFINDGGKVSFYDVINNETIDLSNEYYTNHFDIYYQSFENIRYSKSVSPDEKRDYSINKGITYGDLAIESTHFHPCVTSSNKYGLEPYNIWGTIIFGFEKFDSEKFFSDRTIEEGTTLVKHK